MCFDWYDTCGNFSHCELIKFILIILKRNILAAKLYTNKNVHAQISFAAKSPFISPNRNPPLSEKLQGNGVWKFSIHMYMSQWNVCSYARTLSCLFRISCNIFKLIQQFSCWIGLLMVSSNILFLCYFEC